MHAQVNISAPVMLSNAAAAFGLNMSVFLLIGKTSALTMNVAGVLKDWMLIGLSVLIFQAQVLAPTSADLALYCRWGRNPARLDLIASQRSVSSSPTCPISPCHTFG